MRVQIEGDTVSFMKDIDLCTIYGNLLDNALEACVKMKRIDRQAKPYIDVKTMRIKGVSVIDISNTYGTPVIEEQGVLVTTKKDTEMHGIGLSNIKQLVNDYEGELHIQYDHKVFRVQIIF